MYINFKNRKPDLTALLINMFLLSKVLFNKVDIFSPRLTCPDFILFVKVVAARRVSSENIGIQHERKRNLYSNTIIGGNKVDSIQKTVPEIPEVEIYKRKK